MRSTTPRVSKSSMVASLCGGKVLIWLVALATLCTAMVVLRSLRFAGASRPLREQALLSEVAALRAELRMLKARSLSTTSSVVDAVDSSLPSAAEEEADLWNFMAHAEGADGGNETGGSPADLGMTAEDLLTNRLALEEHMRSLMDEATLLHDNLATSLEELSPSEANSTRALALEQIAAAISRVKSTSASSALLGLPLPEADLTGELQWRFGSGLSAEDAATVVARHFLFPSRHWANPVRHAWIANRLDWHDLVRDVGDGPKATTGPPPPPPPSSAVSGGGAAATSGAGVDAKEGPGSAPRGGAAPLAPVPVVAPHMAASAAKVAAAAAAKAAAAAARAAATAAPAAKRGQMKAAATPQHSLEQLHEKLAPLHPGLLEPEALEPGPEGDGPPLAAPHDTSAPPGEPPLKEQGTLPQSAPAVPKSGRGRSSSSFAGNDAAVAGGAGKEPPPPAAVKASPAAAASTPPTVEKLSLRRKGGIPSIEPPPPLSTPASPNNARASVPAVSSAKTVPAEAEVKGAQTQQQQRRQQQVATPPLLGSPAVLVTRTAGTGGPARIVSQTLPAPLAHRAPPVVVPYSAGADSAIAADTDAAATGADVSEEPSLGSEAPGAGEAGLEFAGMAPDPSTATDRSTDRDGDGPQAEGEDASGGIDAALKQRQQEQQQQEAPEAAGLVSGEEKAVPGKAGEASEGKSGHHRKLLSVRGQGGGGISSLVAAAAAPGAGAVDVGAASKPTAVVSAGEKGQQKQLSPHGTSTPSAAAAAAAVAPLSGDVVADAAAGKSPLSPSRKAPGRHAAAPLLNTSGVGSAPHPPLPDAGDVGAWGQPQVIIPGTKGKGKGKVDDLEKRWYRTRREAAKDELISLLQGYTRLRASHVELAARAADPALGGGAAAGLLDETVERLLDTGGSGALGLTPPPSAAVGSGEWAPGAWRSPAPKGKAKHAPEEGSSSSAAAAAVVGSPVSQLMIEATRWSSGAATAGALDDTDAPFRDAFLTLSLDDLTPLRAPESDHGPLAKYAACGVVRDPCLIHATMRACIEDELCGWCTGGGGRPGAPAAPVASSSAKHGGGAGAPGYCADRFVRYWPEEVAGAPEPLCALPLLVNRDSVPSHFFNISDVDDGGAAAPRRISEWLLPRLAHAPNSSLRVLRLTPSQGGSGPPRLIPAPITSCTALVTRRRPAFFSLSGDNKMGFHFFTGGAGVWVQRGAGGGGLDHLRQHVWTDPASTPEFRHFLHAFSDSCPRAGDTVPWGLCYVLPAEAHAPEVQLKPVPPPTPASSGNGAWVRRLEAALSATALTGLPDPIPVHLPSPSDIMDTSSPATTAPPPLPAPPPLEPVLLAVRRGMRLGFRGTATALRAAADAAVFLPAPNNASSPTATADGIWLPALPLMRALQSAMTPESGSALGPSLRALADRLTSLEATRDLPSISLNVLGLWGTSPPGLAELAFQATQAAKRRAREEARGNGTASALGSGASDDATHDEGGDADYTTEEEERTYRPWGTGEEGGGHSSPVRPRPLITLISRKNKRFLLNEPALVRSLVQGTGAQVLIATLESMPLYEQVRLFRRTDLLIGVHGSGLVNSAFMRPGSALLQLMPYRVSGGGAFFAGPAASAGVGYHELMHDRLEDATHHLHFLGRAHRGSVEHGQQRAAFLSRGSESGDRAMFFSFWINSDTVADVEAVVRRAKAILGAPRPGVRQSLGE